MKISSPNYNKLQLFTDEVDIWNFSAYLFACIAKTNLTFNFHVFLVDLDLDYLERRGGETIGNENADSGTKEDESPADSLDRVKVVFLGASGVGKSSIIRVSYSRILKQTVTSLNPFYIFFIHFFPIL